MATELVDLKAGQLPAARLAAFAAARAAAVKRHSACQRCEACLNLTVRCWGLLCFVVTAP